MSIYDNIRALVKYGLDTGLVEREDEIFTVNKLLELFELDEMEETDAENLREAAGCADGEGLEKILGEMMDYAHEAGIMPEDDITHRDLFDTKIMSTLMPRPSEVIRKFHELYENSPREATDFFYQLSQDSDYIRRYRIVKDQKWTAPTKYGDLDITINLSKPEKDPKAIAAAKLAKQSGYPKCLLCMENVGYAGDRKSVV